MTTINNSVIEKIAKIAKRDSGDFTLQDVAEYLQDKAKPGTKVYVLKVGEWVRVGGHLLYLKSIGGNMDDAWIDVVVREYNPLLHKLALQLIAKLAKSINVVWWHKIPNTNLLLDVWYVGDGSGGTALVFEAK